MRQILKYKMNSFFGHVTRIEKGTVDVLIDGTGRIDQFPEGLLKAMELKIEVGSKIKFTEAYDCEREGLQAWGLVYKTIIEVV